MCVCVCVCVVDKFSFYFVVGLKSLLPDSHLRRSSLLLKNFRPRTLNSVSLSVCSKRNVWLTILKHGLLEESSAGIVGDGDLSYQETGVACLSLSLSWRDALSREIQPYECADANLANSDSRISCVFFSFSLLTRKRALCVHVLLSSRALFT